MNKILLNTVLVMFVKVSRLLLPNRHKLVQTIRPKNSMYQEKMNIVRINIRLRLCYKLLENVFIYISIKCIKTS